jgi:hypothetical protein
MFKVTQNTEPKTALYSISNIYIALQHRVSTRFSPQGAIIREPESNNIVYKLIGYFMCS